MQAAVEFNVIEGTMILALSDEALDEFEADTPGSDEDDEDEAPTFSRKRTVASKFWPREPALDPSPLLGNPVPFRVLLRHAREFSTQGSATSRGSSTSLNRQGAFLPCKPR